VKAKINQNHHLKPRLNKLEEKKAELTTNPKLVVESVFDFNFFDILESDEDDDKPIGGWSERPKPVETPSAAKPAPKSPKPASTELEPAYFDKRVKDLGRNMRLQLERMRVKSEKESLKKSNLLASLEKANAKSARRDVSNVQGFLDTILTAKGVPSRGKPFRISGKKENMKFNPAPVGKSVATAFKNFTLKSLSCIGANCPIHPGSISNTVQIPTIPSRKKYGLPKLGKEEVGKFRVNK